MNTLHTPAIRLAAARRNLDVAEQACPHWDEFQTAGEDHDCCHDLAVARRELRLAWKAFNAT